MGNGFAADSRSLSHRLRFLRNERAGRSARRQRDRFDVRRDWICVHDFRGVTGRTKTRPGVAAWASSSMDARASLAGILSVAVDPVSWRLPFRRLTDTSLDVVADCYSREWCVRSGDAGVLAAFDDPRRAARNDL